MEELIEKLKEIGVGTEGNERILKYLRDIGYSQVQSIMALTKVHGLPLLEAKEIVHLSKTWSDHYETNEKLHDVVESTRLGNQ